VNPLRQATWLALCGLVLALAGCAEQRQEQCRIFAASADACYVNAGLDRFFQENVDCDSPVSSLASYKCLVQEYSGADCSTERKAYEVVDAASEQCLGWSEGLADDLVDDDDSGGFEPAR